MPTTHKICLMGFGNVRRYIQAAMSAGTYVNNITGHEALTVGPNALERKAFDITPDLKLIMHDNYKSLCDIYREVQRKYHPEEDIYVKGK